MEKKARILVIDDDPDEIELVKMALDGEGYEIMVAYNGKEGAERAGRDKPDAVILDIMMPVQDGFATCHQLKANPELSKIPVLVLTAIKDELVKSQYALSQGLQLESDDYIDKPVDPEVLRLRLKELLEESVR